MVRTGESATKSSFNQLGKTDSNYKLLEYMIKETLPDGGGKEATTDDIVDYLATKAGTTYAYAVLKALGEQLLIVAGRQISDDEFEMDVTRTTEKVKVPGKKAYYQQILLYKAIPLVRVEFADDWKIHKLKVKALK